MLGSRFEIAKVKIWAINKLVRNKKQNLIIKVIIILFNEFNILT